MDSDQNLVLEVDGGDFRHLKSSQEFAAYDDLLRRTYLREGIFREEFLPGPSVQRFGLYDGDGDLIAICGLRPTSTEHAAQFETLISLPPNPTRRMIEVVNVVVDKRHYGTSAFAATCWGLSEAALRLGGTLLVGVTRAALLKSFVQFGLYPAVHEPLHLLGDPKVQDFVIYYDFEQPGAIDYMRRRAAQVLEQGRRMALLRTRYLGFERGGRASTRREAEVMTDA